MDQLNNIRECSVVLNPITPQKQLTFSTEIKEIIQKNNMLTCKTRNKVINALEDINKSLNEKSNQEMRSKIVREVLSSELSYLKQLKIIKEYFMKPLKEREILSNSDFQILFGSLETIYNVNLELLQELKKGPENVAKAFLKLAPYFKLYAVYAYGYKNSLHVLQKSQEKNNELSKFLELTESRPEVQSKLSALLITPIQRIPRYRLLLKQIVDYTLPTDSDYSLLLDSLKQIEEIASHINSTLEEQENTQRLLELQRSLQNKYPIIIRPGRQLIKEGVLSKISKNGARNFRRYFVLMNDILMYCKMRKDDPKLPNSLKCCCILPINKCKVTVIPNKGVFRVTCQNEELVLFHERASEGQEWVRALKDAIRVYMDNRLTLRKESSAKRPLRRKGLEQFDDPGISPGNPRRKRNLVTEFTDVFRSKSHDSDNSDEESSKNIFKRLGKRKSSSENVIAVKKVIKTYPINKNHNLQEQKDSLYPLREHLQLKDEKPATCDNSVHIEPSNTTELFVFGRSNNDQRRNFNFNLNFFSSVINSLKNIFNFNRET